MPDRKHRLRGGQCERPQAGTEAADENDGAHQPPVVVVACHGRAGGCRLGRRRCTGVDCRVTRRGRRRGGDHGAAISCAERRQLCRPIGHGDVGALGNDCDHEDHAVVGDADVVEVGDDVVVIVRIVEAIPHPDDQSRVSLPSHLVSLVDHVSPPCSGGMTSSVVGQLDVVACRGTRRAWRDCPTTSSKRVVVDDPVVVTVNAESPELVVQQDTLPGRVDAGLFQRADDLGLQGVADVDAERGMPVGIDVGTVVDPGHARAVAGSALAAVHDCEQAEHDHDGHGDGENGAALEANLLAFASRGEPGDFLGGR